MTITYDQKKKIQDLPELTGDVQIENDYIETTVGNKTYKRTIASLANEGTIVNHAASKKYYTGTSAEGGNDLTERDIALFFQRPDLGYIQDGTKKVYFEKHPILDTYVNSISLNSKQLLSNKNIKDFENYLAVEERYPCGIIPAFNWENELSHTAITEISTFIPTTENEERLTYKIYFDSEERASNIVPLSNITKNGHVLKGVVFYTVIGLISIKSILPDQKTGTVYLEARANDSEEWKTIDSAAFKFLNESTGKHSPGTYVSLNGYLSTNFQTRIRLNLSPKGYSMNVNSNRLLDQALVTNATNTFVGFVYAPCNNDPEFGIEDPEKYFNVHYLYPINFLIPSGAPSDFMNYVRSTWDEFTDVDCDEGEYTLLEAQPNVYPFNPDEDNAPSPEQYRHIRWRDITWYPPTLGLQYWPGQTINLQISMGKYNPTEKTYDLKLSAIYKQIYYKVIYHYGDVGRNETKTYKNKKPTYNYTVKSENVDKVVPYEGDYYKQICWENPNDGNRERYYDEKIELSDRTTIQNPEDPDPATPRELHLNAVYEKIRYVVEYDPNGTTTSWEKYTDDNSGNRYRYHHKYTLHGKRPIDADPEGLIIDGGLEKMHVGWMINGQRYNINEEITLTNDLVLDADKWESTDPKIVKRDAWVIRVTPVYVPRYKIIYTSADGNGRDKDNGHAEITSHVVQGDRHTVISSNWRSTYGGVTDIQLPKWKDNILGGYRAFGSALVGQASNFNSAQLLTLYAVYPEKFKFDNGPWCHNYAHVSNYQDKAAIPMSWNFNDIEGFPTSYTGLLYVDLRISGSADNRNDDNWFAACTSNWGDGVSLILFPFGGGLAYGACSGNGKFGYHFNDNGGFGNSGTAFMTVSTYEHSLGLWLRAFDARSVSVCVTCVRNY